MSLYAKGDRVAQSNYGAGTVIDSNARHTVIDFDQHGRRTFVTSLMALQETTEPAPSRKRRARRPQREGGS